MIECACGNKFEQRVGPGRPFKFCPDCRKSGTSSKGSKTTKKITAEERINRLDIMLKANGTHLSQS